MTHGGVLTVLWHTRSLAPERNWGDFYVRLLKEFQARRPWFGTAAQVVAWFRKRRAISFQHAEVTGRRVLLEMKYAGGHDANRNLLLRIHVPTSQAAFRGAAPFIDVPWTGQTVIDIALRGPDGVITAVCGGSQTELKPEFEPKG